MSVAQLFLSEVALPDGPFAPAEYRHTNVLPYCVAVVRVESLTIGGNNEIASGCRNRFSIGRARGSPAISSGIFANTPASGDSARRATRFRLQYWYLEDAHIAPAESPNRFHHVGRI